MTVSPSTPASLSPWVHWAELHYDGREVTDTDVDADHVPTHPNSGTYACWAITHPRTKLRVPPFPAPTFTVRDPLSQLRQQSVWCMAEPVRLGQPNYDRRLNTWRMICAALTHYLDGVEATQILNPFRFSHQMHWDGKTHLMKQMQVTLEDAKMWRMHLHPEALRAGGRAGTPAQNAARAKTLQALLESKRADQLARNQRIVTLADRGLCIEDLAAELDLAVGSIVTTVERARDYLGSDGPAPTHRSIPTAKTTEERRQIAVLLAELPPTPPVTPTASVPVPKLTLAQMRASLLADVRTQPPSAPVEPQAGPPPLPGIDHLAGSHMASRGPLGGG